MAEIIGIEKEEKARTILSWFQDSYKKQNLWRAEALANYDYVEGNQWESGLRKKIEDAGRPALTFNKILPQVLALSGLQRANRLDIRALPRGSKDTQSADLMSNLIEFVLNRSNGDYEQSVAFEDGLIAGAGYLELLRSFDDDLEGELIVRTVDPLQVFLDPEGRRPDLDDHRFVIKAPFKSVEELVFAFKAQGDGMESKIRDMARRIANDDWLTGSGIDQTLTGNLTKEMGDAWYDKKNKKVRVLETYYRTTTNIPVVVAPDGEIIPVETGTGSTPAFKAAERMAKVIGGEAELRKVKIVRIATLLGWEILQDVPSRFPTRRFPIIPYMPLLFRRQPYGLVRHLKDPQDEINKRRSQMLHHINSSANSGWLNHASEGADSGVLAKIGSEPGTVINYQSVAPVQIVPHPLPPGLAQLDALSDRDLKEIGVQAELAGQGSQRFISGKAIQARQFGGQIQVTRFFDQLRLTRKLLGELLVSVIPRMFSERRIREIVDQEVARSPDGSMAGLVEAAQGSDLESLGEGLDPVDVLIDRARKLRFDIVVEDAPALPTQRQAAFQQLIAMAGLFPGVIDPDLLIEHSDIRNKDELLARVEQKMQAMQAAGIPVQQSSRSANNSERLDVGDQLNQAATLTSGQDGTGAAQ